MAILDRDTTILQLFERFYEVTENVESYTTIMDSMKRIVSTPTVSFTAENDTVVLGQVFVIQSPGFYVVSTIGYGHGSYVVKNPKTLKTLYSGKLENQDTSAVLALTQGDTCYFHAAAPDGESIQIKLTQTHSLFDILTEYLRTSSMFQLSINSRIDNIIANAGDNSTPTELIDLRSDYWGNVFDTAGERMRKTEERVDYLGNLAFPKFEEATHTSTREYEPFTFVHDENMNTYVSIQGVPADISLFNVEYWRKWETRDLSLQLLEQRITALEEKLNVEQTQ